MPLFNEIAVVLFGLIIGSFLTVCIYRIPYGRPEGLDDLDEDESESETSAEEQPAAEPEITMLHPQRSICPACRNQLRWYHNIPLFSWIFLGGKCAFCRTAIPAKYPLVELLSAVCAALSYYLIGLNPTGVLVYAFCATLIVITFIDLKYYIIPDVISIPGSILATLIGAANQYMGWFDAPISRGISETILGIVAGGGFLYLVAEFYIRFRNKTGLGYGDVKLLTLTGALLGPAGALYTIFVGSFLGAVLGVTQLLIRGGKLSAPIPFGPYLALATILYMFTGLGPLLHLHLLLIETITGAL